MKLFARLFVPRRSNLTTVLERQRLARTLPGQTGAVAAAHSDHLAVEMQVEVPGNSLR